MPATKRSQAAESKARRPWLRLAAAAEYLGISERSLERLVADRRITFYKPVRVLLFDPDDLDAFLEKERVPAEGV